MRQIANQDFSGRTALVTGAASGIGKATALLFAERGANVVVTDIRSDVVAQTAAEIEAAGGTALALGVDVTSEEQVQSMIARTMERFGRLDAAFNNAGTNGEWSEIHDLSLEEWNHIVNVDLTSVFLCMKYELRVMLDAGGGAIVNCASGAAHVVAPGLPHYTAAKHGVLGLSKWGARNYVGRNIRVNSICPGITDTYLLQKFIHDDPAIKQLLDETCPRGKVGDPREIAEAVVWMCSDAASYVAGLSMLVDGASVNR